MEMVEDESRKVAEVPDHFQEGKSRKGATRPAHDRANYR
jgi:hypothetical protein